MGLSQRTTPPSPVTHLPLSPHHSPALCLWVPMDQTDQSTYFMSSSTPHPQFSLPSGGSDTPCLSFTCFSPADIRCHSCYKVPVLGCVDRQSCRLEPGHQCLTTNVYLGNICLFSGGGNQWDSLCMGLRPNQAKTKMEQRIIAMMIFGQNDYIPDTGLFCVCMYVALGTLPLSYIQCFPPP